MRSEKCFAYEGCTSNILFFLLLSSLDYVPDRFMPPMLLSTTKLEIQSARILRWRERGTGLVGI